MLFNLVKGYFFSPIRLALKLAFWGALVVGIMLTVFLLTFDLNSWKSEIEAFVSEKTGTEFKINGDIKPGAEWLRPSIVMHDVSTNGKTPVHAKRFEVTLPHSTSEPFQIRANIDGLRIDGRELGDYDIPVMIGQTGVEVTSAKGGLIGGKIDANAHLKDGRAHLDARLDDVAYEHIENGLSNGTFNADIRLDAPGPDYLKTLDGRVTVLGGPGKLKSDALRFWAGDLVTNFLSRGKDQTDLECAVLSFDIEKGVAQARALIIDTEEVTIFGRGRIDLADGYVDMKFTPKPKKATFMTLATPMLVRGPLGQVKVTPDPEAVVKKFGGMLLGVITPAAALLPMMSMGTGVDNPCLKYLEKK